MKHKITEVEPGAGEDAPIYPRPIEFFELPPLRAGYVWADTIPAHSLEGAAKLASLALEICKAREYPISTNNVIKALPDALGCMIEAAKLLQVAEIDLTKTEGIEAYQAGARQRYSVQEVQKLAGTEEIRGKEVLARDSGDKIKVALACGWVPKTDTQLQKYLVLIGRVLGRGWNQPKFAPGKGRMKSSRIDEWRDVVPMRSPVTAEELQAVDIGNSSQGDSFIAWLVCNFPSGVEETIFEFRKKWLAERIEKEGWKDEEKYRASVQHWLRDDQEGWPYLALRAMRKNEVVPPGMINWLLEVQEYGPDRFEKIYLSEAPEKGRKKS